MSALQRRVLLILALVATVAATAWLATQDEADTSREPRRKAAPVAQRDTRPASKTAVEPVTTADLPLENLKRAPHGKEVANLFPSKNWQAPPPAITAKQAALEAARQATPPPPVAPPLPFSAFGQMEESGRTTVFLNQQDRSYAVKAGDVIDKTYRVDTIRDGVVTLTYLPLNLQQTLRTGTN